MRVWIGGGRIGTATSDDDDSEVVVEMDDDVEALRWRSEAEVTRANAGKPEGGVGGVPAGEAAVAAIVDEGVVCERRLAAAGCGWTP